MITCALAESRQAVESSQQFVQCLLQLEVELLVRIETQNPIARRLVDGRVLLRGEPFPFLDEHFRAERFRDLDRVVSRSRVDDDDFALAIRDQRLHARERASDVGLFVKSNDDNGKVHRWSAAILLSQMVCELEIVSHRFLPKYALSG